MSRSDWLGVSGYDACAKRGGGETGLSERAISRACKASAAPVTAMAAEEVTSGSTNATAVTSGFSDAWQQDIEQFVISLAPVSCPQSISEWSEACFFW